MSQKFFSRYWKLRLPRSEPTSSQRSDTKFSTVAKGLPGSRTLTFCQPSVTHPLLTARLEDKPSGGSRDKQLDLQPTLPEGSQWEKELGGVRRSLNSALEAAEEGARAEEVVQQRDRPGPPKGGTRSNDSTFRPSWRIPQAVGCHWGELLGTEANPVRASTTMAFQASKAVRFKLPPGDHSPSVRRERDQTLDGQAVCQTGVTGATDDTLKERTSVTRIRYKHGREAEACGGILPHQQTSRGTDFSYGPVGRLGFGITPTRSPFQGRHLGCVLPSTSPTLRSGAFSILDRAAGLYPAISKMRTINGTLVLHKDLETSNCTFAGSRSSNLFIPRRLLWSRAQLSAGGGDNGARFCISRDGAVPSIRQALSLAAPGEM